MMVSFLGLPSFSCFLFLITRLNFVSAEEDVQASGLLYSAVFEGARCPAEMGCAPGEEYIPSPDYKQDPIYVTVNNTVTVSTTHTILSKTYVASVTTVVGKTEGLCEIFVKTPVTTRPTITVTVDQTSIAHYYKESIVTEQIKVTHTVTSTAACIKDSTYTAAKPSSMPGIHGAADNHNASEIPMDSRPVGSSYETDGIPEEVYGGDYLDESLM